MPDAVALDVAEGGNEEFAYRTDMIINSLEAARSRSRNSPIVFVGYGVVAPEQNWNDYAGLDVKGKTVIVLVNDPGWGNHDETLFKGNALTYYGRWTYKYEEAARQGAAACLIVHETGGARLSVGGRRQQLDRPAGCVAAARGSGAAAAGRRLAHDRSRATPFREGRRELRRAQEERGHARLQADGARREALDEFKNRIDNTSSENVIGMIRGSTRPDEVVVYSAHWDHLGKDPRSRATASTTARSTTVPASRR